MVSKGSNIPDFEIQKNQAEKTFILFHPRLPPKVRRLLLPLPLLRWTKIRTGPDLLVHPEKKV
jgi:hypothetical protein